MYPIVPIHQLITRVETVDPSRRSRPTFRYIDISSIDRDQKCIFSVAEIASDRAPSRARQIVQRDDVLVSTVRPNLNAVALVPRDLDGEIASTGFCVLRANQDALNARYLFYFVRTDAFVASLLQHIRGANYPAVTDSIVKAVSIPLPPLSEQRQIVEILDQADVLRRKRAEADAKAQRILPALFIKMFGDPATNPMGWPSQPLNSLAKPWAGGGFPRDEQGLDEGDLPFIKVSDMNLIGNEILIRASNNWVSHATAKRLNVKPAPSGAIVFPKIGAAIATNKKRVLTRPTVFDNNVIGVVPKRKEDSLFLYTFFLLFDLTRLARSTAVPSIKSSELAALPLPVPPEDLRDKFATIAATLTTLIERLPSHRSKFERLFAVLMHRTFSGELTAKWREAHLDALREEAEEQAEVLASAREENGSRPSRRRTRRAASC